MMGTSLALQWLGLHNSYARDMSSIYDRGVGILHYVWTSKEEKKNVMIHIKWLGELMVPHDKFSSVYYFSVVSVTLELKLLTCDVVIYNKKYIYRYIYKYIYVCVCIYVHLTFEQHRFEPQGSTYTRIFFNSKHCSIT